MALELLSQAYSRTPIGDDAWVLPDGEQTLEDFQTVVAAVEAWEFIQHIKIIEIREENYTGDRLVNGVRFRRLK